jgi:hypothetical protein
MQNWSSGFPAESRIYNFIGTCTVCRPPLRIDGNLLFAAPPVYESCAGQTMKGNNKQMRGLFIMKSIKYLLKISVIPLVTVMGWPGSAVAATNYMAYDITPPGTMAVANCIDGTHIGGCSLQHNSPLGDCAYDVLHQLGGNYQYKFPYVWTVDGANTTNTATDVTVYDSSNGKPIGGNITGIAGTNVANNLCLAAGAITGYSMHGNLSYNPNSPYTPIAPTGGYSYTPLVPTDQYHPHGIYVGGVLGTDGHFFVGVEGSDAVVFAPSSSSDTGWDMVDLVLAANSLNATNPNLAPLEYFTPAKSYAFAIQGTNIVGLAGDTYAVLWHMNPDGSLHDVVDLTFVFSPADARGVSGDLIVGEWGGVWNNGFACLWYGTYTNQSVPFGGQSVYSDSGLGLQLTISNSCAVGVSKARNEVVGGYGYRYAQTVRTHACVWNLAGDESTWLAYANTGAPTNWMVDLSKFLPTNITWNNSCALAIDDQGDIVGYASASDQSTHAILWVPVSAGPAAPTGLTAVGGCEQVTLSWNGSYGATNYNVNVKRRVLLPSGNSLPKYLWWTIASPTTTNYTNTGLADGRTYCYMVTAVNSAGESGYSGEVCATPRITTPTGLQAVGGNGQVTLSWGAVPCATNYNVKRRVLLPPGKFLPKYLWLTIASPTTTNYTNTNLLSGGTYYYVVSAGNSAGESTNSSEVSATAQ